LLTSGAVTPECGACLEGRPSVATTAFDGDERSPTGIATTTPAWSVRWGCLSECWADRARTAACRGKLLPFCSFSRYRTSRLHSMLSSVRPIRAF